MFELLFIGSLIAVAVGGVLWLVLHYVKSDYKLTPIEMIISTAALLALVVPLTSWVGTKLAFQNQVSYNEYWGGYETQALISKTTCERDGSCVNTYSCDPYEVWETSGYYDSSKPPKWVDTSHYVTHYHDCPYATEEDSYYVNTTVGQYTIAANIFPPYAQEWRSGSGFDGVSRQIPSAWSAAKQRLDSGNPGPVTKENSYDNYILASSSTILHQYSPSIKSYQDKGLLPKLNHQVYNFYYLDRVYAVGVNLPNIGAWQTAINRFDAAIGASLQGDVYVVIVDANKVTDPDDYANALTAYWESPAFGKDAISKNAIVVVLGTKDGKTVSYARAKTGMPVGNEEMLYAIKDQLAGVALTPDAVLGNPTPSISVAGKNTYKVTINHTTPNQGALEAVVWGQHAFARVCMTCQSENDKKGGVGYSYLKSEIQPSGGQQVLICLVIFLLSCGVWGGAVYFGAPYARQFYRR
jgi:hypothetical protein